MPLIRNAPDRAADAADQAVDLQTVLLHGSPEDRWAAARAIAKTAAGLQALAGALAAETDPRVREAIFTGLVNLGSPASATVVLPYLRSDDANMRTGALDALRAMPGAAKPHLATLLRDRDADVRLLACEIVRNLPTAEATPLLCDLLDSERERNVCAAAVDVLAEMGGPDVLPALTRCAARFRDEPFLGFAIDIAADRCRLRSAAARE